MKRYLAICLFAVLLGMMLSGCDFWMDGHYVSVEPHQAINQQDVQEVVAVSNSVQMRSALLAFVEKGRETGIISVSSFNEGTVHFFMDSAVRYVMNSTPMGAYAVDDITYEIGTNGGEAAIALQISYRFDRTQLQSICKAKTVGEAADFIYAALGDCRQSVAIRVDRYEPEDYQELIREYAAANPDIVMEIPQVDVNVYPNRGDERILEFAFTYQTSREQLLRMQEQVQPVFASAELYVRGDTQVREKYVKIYNFLMERYDYTIGSSFTPTYSLLQQGVGDGETFANVYARMCRDAGLECHVVHGTKDQEPWVWNLIYFQGGYYHIDLLSCLQTGGFACSRMSELEGYEWDASSYPGR